MRIDEVYATENQKKVLLLAGQHGDEHAGISIASAFLPMKSQNLVVIPCLNLDGYKADTREKNGIDLNREYMNLAEQPTPIECQLIKKIAQNVDLIIDVHSTPEDMLDQPCCLVDQDSEHYGSMFGVELVRQEAPQGSLRNYCVHNGIPMVTYEAVERRPGDQEQVEIGIDGILKILEECGLN